MIPDGEMSGSEDGARSAEHSGSWPGEAVSGVISGVRASQDLHRQQARDDLLKLIASKQLATDSDARQRDFDGMTSETGMESGIPAEIGKTYRIVRCIGRGGMGEVWEAEHRGLGKRFALKFVRGGPTDERRRRRLVAEARAAARVHHENVVEIADLGETTDGTLFIVMELLRGQRLVDLVRTEGRVEWSRARPILGQLADALGYAHRQGVIHRDLKPENVIVINRRAEADYCKIIDFGLASVREGGEDLTRTGEILGSPSTMSPEQFRGEAVDERCDVYALGCIAYELLSGKAIFDAVTPEQFLYHHLQTPPPPLPTEVLDPARRRRMDALIARAVSKRRDDRFSSMEEFRAALEYVESGKGRGVGRPYARRYVFAGAVAVLAATSWTLLPQASGWGAGQGSGVRHETVEQSVAAASVVAESAPTRPAPEPEPVEVVPVVTSPAELIVGPELPPNYVAESAVASPDRAKVKAAKRRRRKPTRKTVASPKPKGPDLTGGDSLRPFHR